MPRYNRRKKIRRRVKNLCKFLTDAFEHWLQREEEMPWQAILDFIARYEEHLHQFHLVDILCKNLIRGLTTSGGCRRQDTALRVLEMYARWCNNKCRIIEKPASHILRPLTVEDIYDEMKWHSEILTAKSGAGEFMVALLKYGFERFQSMVINQSQFQELEYLIRENASILPPISLEPYEINASRKIDIYDLHCSLQNGRVRSLMSSLMSFLMSWTDEKERLIDGTESRQAFPILASYSPIVLTQYSWIPLLLAVQLNVMPDPLSSGREILELLVSISRENTTGIRLVTKEMKKQVWRLKELGAPRSLSQLCRRSIREHVWSARSYSKPYVVRSLDLPDKIKDFILGFRMKLTVLSATELSDSE